MENKLQFYLLALNQHLYMIDIFLSLANFPAKMKIHCRKRIFVLKVQNTIFLSVHCFSAKCWLVQKDFLVNIVDIIKDLLSVFNSDHCFGLHWVNLSSCSRSFKNMNEKYYATVSDRYSNDT